MPFLNGTAPWWVPLLTVGAVSTAFAYVAGLAAIRMLGARLAAFLGLSEVVFAGIVGWILIGEALGPLQILGGLLILGGIVCVRMERPAPAAARVVELGGEILPDMGSGETEESVARFGRFKFCKDDQGSSFGLHEPPV
jgi:hypothetical protein